MKDTQEESEGERNRSAKLTGIRSTLRKHTWHKHHKVLGPSLSSDDLPSLFAQAVGAQAEDLGKGRVKEAPTEKRM